MARRRKGPRFDLSDEARSLILDGTGRWEHVELDDGPAAQAMVPGVKARPTPLAPAPADPMDERPEDHPDLFGGDA